MPKVLFICHGNICRSPISEFVLKDMVEKLGIADKFEFVFRDMVRRAGREDEFYIESAATSREEIGNDTHPGTKGKLRENGIPFERHYARQITKADYDKFDYLIGMDDANVRNIQRICGDPEHKITKLLDHAGANRSIADPWYTGNFDETYDDVIEGCEALREELL